MKIKILFIVALLVAPFSLVQAAVNTASTQAMIQAIVKGSAGPTVNAVGTGVIATSAGQVLVPASGLVIPVAVSVAASVGRGSIARAAVAALGGPLGGAVAVAAAVAPLLPRYHLCPAGSADVAAFYCKDALSGPGPMATLWKYSYNNGNTQSTFRYSSPSAACAAVAAQFNDATHNYSTTTSGTATSGQCSFVPAGMGTVFYSTDGTVGCPGGAAPDTTKPVGQQCTVVDPAATLTKPQLEQSLQDKMTADFNQHRQLYEALKKDQADAIANGRGWPDTMNPVETATPLTVTAPPVTGPLRTVSVETRPATDGGTETVTRTEQTTVTPQTSGTTVGDSSTKYITSTVITTAVTNNTTNVTNTTTETVTDEVPPDEKPDPCPPNTDLVSCARLGQIPDKEAIPNVDVPVTYSPVVFQSNASCPAAVTFSAPIIGARSISWQPFCDVMGQLRPLFLACAAAACAWIFLDGMKGI